jgi:stage IV sporulation protein FB
VTFTLGRCRVTVGFPFLAVIALLLTLDRSGMAAAGLLCAALHEAAHLAAMAALRCLPREVRFTPFGIDILKPGRAEGSYRRDVWVSLSGPLANLAASALAFAFFGMRFPRFVLGNFLLFAFNALPIAPLDGGQALFALLCLKMEPEDAERISSVLSFVLLAPLALVGFLILLRSRWNFSLLLVCCYLLALLLLKKEGQY